MQKDSHLAHRPLESIFIEASIGAHDIRGHNHFKVTKVRVRRNPKGRRIHIVNVENELIDGSQDLVCGWY